MSHNEFDHSHKLALAILRTATEEGTLSDTNKAELAELVELIGLKVRPELEGVFETFVAAKFPEVENVNFKLIVYYQEYTSLPDWIKSSTNWKDIATRLLKNDGEKLKKVKDMQGESQLVGIDAKGKALFKDKGVEPVMYGFDEEGKLLKIYNRDPEQMERVVKWANYFEMREQVLKDGYELFADNGYHNFSEEMRQAADHTKEPFVASKDRKEWRASWLESGDRPGNACNASLRSGGGDVHVFGENPEIRSDGSGVIRLLRV